MLKDYKQIYYRLFLLFIGDVMATLESAKKKWERKMAAAGERWKRAISPEKYAKGLAEFGTPVGPETLRSYTEGVNAVTPSEFQAAVAGKGEKWATRLKEAVAR